MEDRLRSFAVSVATIRGAGAGGYPSNAMMVNLNYAQTVVSEVLQANKVLITENNKLSKMYEVAKTELDMLKKQHPEWRAFY